MTPERLSTEYTFAIAFITSLLINRTVNLLHERKCFYPRNVLESNDQYQYWRYRNFLISFLHAVLTGLGSLWCIIQTPSLLSDVVYIYSEFGCYLTALSLGYFLYDIYEMFTHLSYKGTVELIFHHILIVLCFGNTLVCQKYIGYTMTALLIENSNIFLHFRQLLLLSNHSKSVWYYRVNAVINIVMFVLIRGICMFWLWVTLIVSLPITHWCSALIALTSMVGISITTVILFKRVLNSDFVIQNGGIDFRVGSTPRSDLVTDSDKVLTQSEVTENDGNSSNSVNGFRKRLNNSENISTGTTAAVVVRNNFCSTLM